VTWFKIDDGFDNHPKIIKVGNAAAGLYVRCGAYCARHLTDGFISNEICRQYGSKRLFMLLVKEGLWEPTSDGYIMHDYLSYNPSRAEVEAERKAAAERQRQSRERRRSHAVSHAVTGADVTRDSQRESRRESRVTSRRESQDPDPTRPDPTPTTSADDFEREGSTSAAGATSAPRERGPRGSRIPDDFEVTPSMVSWARENAPHANGRVETDKFRDYWTAKSGKDATKIDWSATWRNWMRTAEEQAGRTNGTARNAERIPTTTARVAAIEALKIPEES
jgi:hypothetical protein